MECPLFLVTDDYRASLSHTPTVAILITLTPQVPMRSVPAMSASPSSNTSPPAPPSHPSPHPTVSPFGLELSSYSRLFRTDFLLY